MYYVVIPVEHIRSEFYEPGLANCDRRESYRVEASAAIRARQRADCLRGGTPSGVVFLACYTLMMSEILLLVSSIVRFVVSIRTS